MVLILIALIVLSFLGYLLAVWGDDSGNFMGCFIGILCTAGAGVGLVAYAFSGWNYMAAEYKADIINREYGTNYTQQEVFYASDVIETVRELNRTRLEVNGDLLKDK